MRILLRINYSQLTQIGGKTLLNQLLEPCGTKTSHKLGTATLILSEINLNPLICREKLFHLSVSSAIRTHTSYIFSRKGSVIIPLEKKNHCSNFHLATFPTTCTTPTVTCPIPHYQCTTLLTASNRNLCNYRAVHSPVRKPRLSTYKPCVDIYLSRVLRTNPTS